VPALENNLFAIYEESFPLGKPLPLLILFVEDPTRECPFWWSANEVSDFYWSHPFAYKGFSTSSQVKSPL